MDYFEYKVVRWDIPKYREELLLLDKIKTLDFYDTISCRAILNRRYFSSKDDEIVACNKRIKTILYSIFNYLDQIEDPYKKLLTPIYQYNTFNRIYKLYKLDNTGVENIDISILYAKYKLGL